MRTTLIAACLALLATTTTLAQTDLKIGYTNVGYIFSISPKAKQIEAEMKTRTTMLQKQIEDKEKELQAKYEDYQKNKDSMMESIRSSKEEELRSLDQSIMTLRRNGEAELKNKYEQLLAPESDRINDAIDAVAKENNYTYVFNGDPQIMLYGVDKYDVTDLVLAKLGIAKPTEDGGEAAKPSGSSAPATTPARPAPSNTKTPPRKK